MMYFEYGVERQEGSETRFSCWICDEAMKLRARQCAFWTDLVRREAFNTPEKPARPTKGNNDFPERKKHFQDTGLKSGPESAIFMESCRSETEANRKNRPFGRGGHHEN